ncbi:TetR/AcrR family transcriptional regulator [Pseudonocardia acaciae]|uniref:TetR/AcrR family transcriptional regulator n=1 Tax=Pseudonocardia acaciae TaxID=551276 RepID=UPI00068871C8|nr:TetR/AcrR family transcriptional regulator [Pseudonocardia acaciae]
MAGGRSRRQPGERRQEIVDTAIELAEAIGLDRVTSRDVAAAMGVTSGLVHHYFATTEELIIAAFRHFADEERDECRRETAPLEPLPALRAYLLRGMRHPRRPTVARLWMSAWIAAPRRQGLAAEVDRQMRADQELLRDLLARGIAEGVFELADPAVSAHRILVLFDGILVQLSMRKTDTIYDDIGDLGWETVEHEVGLPAGALHESRPAAR